MPPSINIQENSVEIRNITEDDGSEEASWEKESSTNEDLSSYEATVDYRQQPGEDKTRSEPWRNEKMQ